MPANVHLQALAEDDDIPVPQLEPGVLTLDAEVAGEVEDWLAALDFTVENEVTTINNTVEDGVTVTNNAVEDEIVSTHNAADNEAVTTTNSVEGGVTATMDIPEDDHEDEFLATTSSYNPEDSHDTTEAGEEVEEETLESVS